jgi:hypothetical protein
MASENSNRRHKGRLMPVAAKVVIAGGFGAGKTTLVSAVSESRPLHTEETLTNQGVGIDDLSGVDKKSTTTVAMDFGRITISSHYVLYLFGTPGQKRFYFMWDELAYGALGAVVLADTRRLEDAFPSIDYFERLNIPFIVAVNCFDGAHEYDLTEVKMALQLGDDVPVLLCDARERESCKQVLITVVEHAMETHTGGRHTSEPAGRT